MASKRITDGTYHAQLIVLLGRFGFIPAQYMLDKVCDRREIWLNPAVGLAEALDEVAATIASLPANVLAERHLQTNGRFIFRVFGRSTMWVLLVDHATRELFNAFLDDNMGG